MVDCGHRPCLDEQNIVSKLSRYVQSLGHRATALDPDHNFGILHRLDVPSSGLVLVAKTYKAYYDLQLQLNVGSVTRDYVVLCHGWMSPKLREITARAYWIKDSDLPSEIQREEFRNKLFLLGSYLFFIAFR